MTPSEETVEIPLSLTEPVVEGEEIRRSIVHAGFVFDLAAVRAGVAEYRPRAYVGEEKEKRKRRGRRGGKRHQAKRRK